MEDRFISMIGVIALIAIAVAGLYLMYETTYGKSVAGQESFIEAAQTREAAQKAIELNVDKAKEMRELYDILKERETACVTLVNTRTLAIQQEHVKDTNQIPAIESMIEVRSIKLGPTWKLVDVGRLPCRPLEQLIG